MNAVKLAPGAKA